MSQRGKTITFGAVGALSLGLILEAVSVGTNAWAEQNRDAASVGLFKACGLLSCVDFEKKTDKLMACEAFAIIGILASSAAAGCGLFHLITILRGRVQNKNIALLALPVGVFSFVSKIITIGLFVGVCNEYGYEDAHYGYSFALSVVAAVLEGSGGIFMFLAAREISI